ncbi:MAG TPA: hypothetical protein VGN57_06625 [Pirellulaceae bacterium]|jgi:tetratricopeptide (TPR) repeat protein|nr:hypothetical protein [Pirellulaceae bacterium]
MRAAIASSIVVFLLCGGSVVAQRPGNPPNGEPTYLTAEEAFAVGAAHRNAKNFAAAEAPLEAALKLSDDESFRVKVYSALIPSYRLHADVDDLAAAVEYVVEKGERLTERANAATALIAYGRERSVTDALLKRYEGRLEERPDDRAALFLLSELYGGPKRDAKRRIELLDRLIAIERERGEPQTVAEQAEFAQLYMKAEKFSEAAELYETAARGDEKLAAWHWKEAATAWLKAGEPQIAIKAAKASAASAPESRSELLTHFWHKGLADVLLDAGEPALAISHYEQAIGTTTIEGYRKASQARLAEARQRTAAP